jgi:hypothetical protein
VNSNRPELPPLLETHRARASRAPVPSRAIEIYAWFHGYFLLFAHEGRILIPGIHTREMNRTRTS